MGPRQEIRIESINRLHVQSGVRDVQEPQIRRHVLENGHLVALGIPHLLVYTDFLFWLAYEVIIKILHFRKTAKETKGPILNTNSFVFRKGKPSLQQGGENTTIDPMDVFIHRRTI